MNEPLSLLIQLGAGLAAGIIHDRINWTGRGLIRRATSAALWIFAFRIFWVFIYQWGTPERYMDYRTPAAMIRLFWLVWFAFTAWTALLDRPKTPAAWIIRREAIVGGVIAGAVLSAVFLLPGLDVQALQSLIPSGPSRVDVSVDVSPLDAVRHWIGQ